MAIEYMNPITFPDNNNNNNNNNNNLANLNHRVIERGDAGPDLVDPTTDHLRTIGTGLSELPNSNVVTRVVQTETELFETFVALVRHIDPDVLVGYEVQKESLGKRICGYVCGYVCEYECICFCICACV